MFAHIIQIDHLSCTFIKDDYESKRWYSWPKNRLSIARELVLTRAVAARWRVPHCGPGSKITKAVLESQLTCAGRWRTCPGCWWYWIILGLQCWSHGSLSKKTKNNRKAQIATPAHVRISGGLVLCAVKMGLKWECPVLCLVLCPALCRPRSGSRVVCNIDVHRKQQQQQQQ